MPVERFLFPLNGIERLVATLSSLNVLCRANRRAKYTRHFSGAEWWIQDVSADEHPKSFHTDCDIHLSVDSSVITHPLTASVLYLGDSGGATAIFGQVKDVCRVEGDTSYTLKPTLPVDVAIVHPQRNRLLLFGGDKYHAVMHAARQPRVLGQRVGLLHAFTVYQRLTTDDKKPFD